MVQIGRHIWDAKENLGVGNGRIHLDNEISDLRRMDGCFVLLAELQKVSEKIQNRTGWRKMILFALVYSGIWPWKVSNVVNDDDD